MFLFRGVDSHPRSLVKAISWRALGSIDTFVLSYIFTGSTAAAASLAGTEVSTKIMLFSFPERACSLVHWGHRLTPADRDDQSGYGSSELASAVTGACHLARRRHTQK